MNKKTLMAINIIATSPLFILLLIIFCFDFIRFVAAMTNISTTEFLTDPETMMSNNRRFKVGFFSPVNSTNRYAAICFNIEDSAVPWDVVWVANRNNPMKDSSGVLKISIEDGNLQLVGRQDFVFWSSNVSSSSLRKANSTTSTYAKLQGTGNLILLSHDSEVILWQSFEHLTNSLLPQTRVSIDKGVHKFDENSILQSWASASDPSDGRFRMGVSHGPFSELVTWKDDRPYWRSGPWNGNAFVGVIPGALNGIRIEKSAKEGTVEMVYTEATYKSVFVYYLLNSDGNFVYRLWDNAKQEWENRWQSIESECDSYGKCGPFGNCNPSGSPMCSCLTGFEPTNSDEWSTGNWTSGCTRKTSLQCTNTSSSGGKEEDGFFKLINVKVPDYAVFVLASNEGECRLMCLRNCSCLAYAYPKGIGCMSWIESLIDLQQFSVQAGADVFVRLDHSELGETSNKKTSKMKKSVIAIIAIVAAICTIVAFTYFLWIWLHRRRYGKQPSKATYNVGFMKENRDEFKDLPLFNFNELDVATNFFDEINKLGEGGFGPVYKGILENGQEIAVKRLSKASGQGLEEFMNEVLVISKLQHKNLVKLFGCCVEEEKLLVYEYLPNRSLDTLLFDPKYQIQLDWMTRYNIIKGICRGLLYLHRDSRMKIIHRDLKASNVLLDEELNPKISDFGMARIFETKQDQANTERVVGTYGYMSPEYAMEGLFSEKSDIFSLGVLLLEIISGRKNSSFLQYESLSLLSYVCQDNNIHVIILAWKLWNKNNMRSLIDPIIFEPCFEGEILKCIQLGLLCVQEIPEDRPSTTVVISMLDVKDIMDLPLPKQPGFTLTNVSSTEITQNDHEYGSIHHVTLTVLKGR